MGVEREPQGPKRFPHTLGIYRVAEGFGKGRICDKEPQASEEKQDGRVVESTGQEATQPSLHLPVCPALGANINEAQEGKGGEEHGQLHKGPRHPRRPE